MYNKFKQFVTCHSHPSSFDSGSTPESMAKREVELGTGYITVTDHGTLEGNRLIYDMCNKGGKFHEKLTPILGLEAYFRPSSCSILEGKGIEKSVRFRHSETHSILSEEKYSKLAMNEKGSYNSESGYWNYLKYMHLTMHFMDQEAYETGVKLLSKADLNAEQHGSERKPIFDWSDLEELGSKNVTFCSSCLIGAVTRHLLVHNDFETAEKYYQKLRSLVKPGNFYVEVHPHVCDKNWDEGVFLKYADGTQDKFPLWKKLRTEAGEFRAEEISASILKNKSNLSKHNRLLAVMQNRKLVDVEPKEIISVEYRQDFLKNECTSFAPNGDVQLGANKFVIEMAKKYGDKITIADDSHFDKPESKIAQDVRLGQSGSWKFANSYYRMSSEDAWGYFNKQLSISKSEFESWIENSHDWASKFKDFKFKQKKALPTSFYPSNTVEHTLKLIEKHGRMDWNNKALAERLEKEINLLHGNGTIDLLPYFFVAEEACDVYLKNGELTGPGRGSASGLALTYLLGITHVNALDYDLSMDRFLTKTRIESGKYPDVDMDFPHRDLFVDPNNPEKGWLKERFGDCVAQISTVSTMKLKSSIKDVFRAIHGVGSKELEFASSFSTKLQSPPPGMDDKDYVLGYEDADGHIVPGLIDTNDDFRQFVSTYPKEWEAVLMCLGLYRSKGRHAAAYLIADEPVSNFIPLTTVGGHRVTQYTMQAVESSGGTKMDFLVINSLKDIQDCIKLIQDRSKTDVDWKSSRQLNETPPSMIIDGKKVPYIRIVPFNGNFYDVYNLPSDVETFNAICEGKTDGVFQFCTSSAKQWLGQFNHVKSVENGKQVKALDSIEALSIFTALDRPGPLDAYVEDINGNKHNMLVEYANRAKGLNWSGDTELNIAFNELIPETFGILVYQEQLTKIFMMLGKTSGAEADEFRVHISKKQQSKLVKDKAVFMKGATEKFGEVVAEKVWELMESWANYGFCIDGDQKIETNQGQISMKRIVNDDIPGLMVLSYNEKTGKTEFIEPSAKMNMGVKEVFEIELDDGSTVKATEDHRFLYNNEWVKLKDLIEHKDMEILTCKKK